MYIHLNLDVCMHIQINLLVRPHVHQHVHLTVHQNVHVHVHIHLHVYPHAFCVYRDDIYKALLRCAHVSSGLITEGELQ